MSITRMEQMTGQVVAEQAAWVLIENSFGSSPCLSNKRLLCDQALTQELLDITITDTIAMAACAVLTPAGPPAVAFCFAAVLIVHRQRIEAAKQRHRSCYIRARIECTAVSIIPMCQRGTADLSGVASEGNRTATP